MASATFIFADFDDNFTLTGDKDIYDWPLMEAIIDFTFHPPEPDVGIFHDQIDIQKVTCLLGDDEYPNEDDFAIAVYATIANDIAEDEAAVAEQIRRQINDWITECDQFDREIDEPDFGNDV